VEEISVVRCTYYGARYVGTQLASVLSQTRPPAEVTVADDGSTDAVVLPHRLAEYRQHAAQAYGGLKGRTVRERVATRLANGQSQMRYLAGVAAHRAALLEAGSGAAWTAGAGWWRTIEAHLARRERLYHDISAGRRASILVGSLGEGAYRAARHGGLGSRRLLEDVVVTVMRSSPAGRRMPCRHDAN
jgi:hypothetical protein